MNEIFASIKKLENYLEKTEFKGYEFDDLLGSPIVSKLTFQNLFLKRIAVQIGKLSPINFRKLVGVKKLESAKAYGFIAKGFLNLYLSTNDTKYIQKSKILLDWLLENYSNNYKGISWGNSFDFASRGGFFPKDLPTVVWTAHIAEAFDLGYKIIENSKYRQAVIDAGYFVFNCLDRHIDKRGTCIAYAPGVLNLVHNSNLLGAITLLRAWKYNKNDSYLHLARESIKWSLYHMNKDGSWYYGVGEKYKWIDNFHTAYNIACLRKANEIYSSNIVDPDIIMNGFSFWMNNFFLDNGAPKYYNHKALPYDIQCASQAIETLLDFSDSSPKAKEILEKLLRWTIMNMQKKNGSFRFQINKYYKNNLESFHWGQATMLTALGYYSFKNL
jgi:hypothetical protein